MKKKSTVLKNMLSGIIILAAVTLMSCNANKSGYTITGTIDPDVISFDSIYLYNQKMETIASAPMQDGRFEMKGKTEQPQKLVIGNIAANFGLEIILENATYTMVVNDDEFSLKGGNIHDKVMGFNNNAEYNNALEEYHAAEDEFFAIDEKDTAKLKVAEVEMDEKAKAVMKIQDDHFRRLLEGNEPTLTKLFALNQSQDWRGYPIEKRLELLDTYEKELGKHELIDEYRQYLTTEEELTAAAETVAVGQPFINIAAQTRDKETVELARVVSENEYTLLDFWASWCGPCRAEMPHLKKEYEKYKDKGFEIYAISLDDKESDWLKALDEENTPWINVHNAEGFNGEVVKLYGIQGIPSAFLIDKEGTIVASNDDVRGDDLATLLESLLK
ncbi:MAG: TlpA disulfide reductase family protein [Bacteroidia bacterium]|nr:TlpA disulfide reductase family protein [Bacteroidia bacterium]